MQERDARINRDSQERAKGNRRGFLVWERRIGKHRITPFPVVTGLVYESTRILASRRGRRSFGWKRGKQKCVSSLGTNGNMCYTIGNHRIEPDRRQTSNEEKANVAEADLGPSCTT